MGTILAMSISCDHSTTKGGRIPSQIMFWFQHKNLGDSFTFTVKESFPVDQFDGMM